MLTQKQSIRIVEHVNDKLGINPVAVEFTDFGQNGNEGIITLGRAHSKPKLIQLSVFLDECQLQETYIHELAHIFYGPVAATGRNSQHNLVFMLHELSMLALAYNRKCDEELFDDFLNHVRSMYCQYIEAWQNFSTVAIIINEFWKLPQPKDIVDLINRNRQLSFNQVHRTDPLGCNLSLLTSAGIKAEVSKAEQLKKVWWKL